MNKNLRTLVERDLDGGFVERYYILNGTDVKDGNYFVFFPSENFHIIGAYDHDRPVGLWQKFTEDGVVIEEALMDYHEPR